MRNDRTSIVVTIAVLVVVLSGAVYVFYEYRSPTGFYAREHADIQEVRRDGDRSPYRDLEGNEVDLTQFQGKPLVVNVWASWSPYSRSEIPLFSELAQKYDGALTVVLINRKETRTTVRAYLNEINAPGDVTYLIDETDHFYRTLGGYAMPETVFFDSVGNVVSHTRGVTDPARLQEQVDTLIQGER